MCKLLLLLAALPFILWGAPGAGMASELLWAKDIDARAERLSEVIHTRIQPRLDPDLALKVAEAIIREAKANKLPPSLIVGIIHTESNFRPMVTSNRGAVGLMQVRYKTWKEHPILKDNGVTAQDKLYWVDLNIKCGCLILAKYLKEADGDIIKALWRYNSGSTRLPKGQKRHEISYANKVIMKAYETSLALSEWLERR